MWGGTPETVANISLENIHKYMQRQYNPANVVISVAGSVTHQEVVELVEAGTGHWRPLEALDWEPVVDGHLEPVAQVGQRRTDQSHLCLALPGLSLSDSRSVRPHHLECDSG